MGKTQSLGRGLKSQCNGMSGRRIAIADGWLSSLVPTGAGDFRVQLKSKMQLHVLPKLGILDLDEQCEGHVASFCAPSAAPLNCQYYDEKMEVSSCPIFLGRRD